MAVWAVRIIFLLVIFGVGWAAIADEQQPLGDSTWSLLAASLVIGVMVIVGDYVAPRKKLSIFAGAFFGLLVGIILAYAISFVVQPIIAQIATMNFEVFRSQRQIESFTQYANLIVGAITCYFAISFILQTKDDFRFIIPYVEFSKQTKGSRPVIVDTSALVDGRVADVAAVGMFDSQLIVPRFVLNELQQIADSADKLKRNRGRRGLDVLKQLQETPRLDIVIHEASHLDAREHPVDQLIMTLASELNARVLTTDFNLNKVAQVGGVDVINVNELANALKPEVLPGERLSVRIVKPGEQADQGIGYLDDGTIVVVEHGKPHIESEIGAIVTNTRQTSAGKMIFARIVDLGDEPADAEPGRTESARPEPARPEPPRRGNGGSGRSPRRGGEHRG